MRVSVIGVGLVGRTYAYTLLGEPYVSEMDLVDIIPGLGKALRQELKVVAASLGKNLEINAYEDPCLISNSDLIIIAAGTPRKPGMSRRDLAGANAKVIKDIAEKIVKNNPEAFFVVVTNPVDALAMLFKKLSDAELVIGTGTFLDSIRLKVVLSEFTRVPIERISTLVIGEHGENMVPVLSSTMINGVKFTEYLNDHPELNLDRALIKRTVSSMAGNIIAKLGGTSFSPAACFREISKAILLDEMRIFPVAHNLVFENSEVFANWLFAIGRHRVEQVPLTLDPEETHEFRMAVESIKVTYEDALKNI
ncbi:MAG: malate dehydrogenase [Candidatus Bathyarchaeia archaeon]